MQKSRRQFSIDIIKCDGFVSLPATAQALYLHLCMSADDEGFTSQLETCKFHAHATDEDVERLVKRRFIIQLGDDGEGNHTVTVIKHWWLNNYIRDDKIVQSTFTERASVYIKENGNYTLDSSQGKALPPLKDSKQAVKRQYKGSQQTASLCPSPRTGDNPIQSNPIQSNPTKSNLIESNKTQFKSLVEIEDDEDI